MELLVSRASAYYTFAHILHYIPLTITLLALIIKNVKKNHGFVYLKTCLLCGTLFVSIVWLSNHLTNSQTL